MSNRKKQIQVEDLVHPLADCEAVGRCADILVGGFPCNNVSYGGHREGVLLGNESGLWFEMWRVIRQVRPRYVLIENVPGLRTKGLEVVLKGLAEIGYDAEWCHLSALEAGAPHRRKRIFIFAYPAGTVADAESDDQQQE